LKRQGAAAARITGPCDGLKLSDIKRLALDGSGMNRTLTLTDPFFRLLPDSGTCLNRSLAHVEFVAQGP
jgi:hypothetical protein